MELPKGRPYEFAQKKPRAPRIRGTDSKPPPQLYFKRLKKKIRSLRDQYNKEHIKVLNSTKSGSGTDDIYIPALWNYDELHQMFSRTEARDECPHVCTFS